MGWLQKVIFIVHVVLMLCCQRIIFPNSLGPDQAPLNYTGFFMLFIHLLNFFKVNFSEK